MAHRRVIRPWARVGAASVAAMMMSSPALAAPAVNLKPGLYEARFVVNLNGAGMPALSKGEQQRRLCLSANDLKDDPRKLIDRLLAPSGLRCVYKDVKQTAQAASVAANCEYLALRSTGTANATFQGDRFRFASSNTLATPIGEALFKVNGVGTRVGECPPTNATPAPSAPAPVVSVPLPPTTPRVPAPARDR